MLVRLFAVVMVAFLFWFGGFSYLRHRFNGMETTHLSAQTNALQMVWQTIVGSYATSMESYCDIYIQQEPVLDLLREARQYREQGDEANLAIVRAQLYRLLYPVYQRLQRRDVRQLQFHTQDNISFLRFHAPHRSGDSVEDSRPSVVMANRDHRIVQGFETGRVLSGFRNVFPLISQGEELGSVEFSQPFAALRRQLSEMDQTRDYKMFFYAPLLLPKLFPEQKKLYTPSKFSPDWLVEDARRELLDSPPDISPAAQTICDLLARSSAFTQALAVRKACSIVIKTPDEFWRVTLLPIIDVEGFPSALMLSFAPDPQVKAFHRNYFWNVFWLSLMVMIGAGISFQFLQKKRALQEKKQRLQLIANTMSDGLLVIDRSGNISFVNRAGTEIMGYALSEMLGQRAHDFLHPHEEEQGEALPCPLCKLLKDGNSGLDFHGEDEFVRKDGSHFVTEVNASPMIQERKHVGLVLIFRDITERKQIEDELNQLSHTDPLTNIFNRRYFMNVLTMEAERVRRYGAPLSLMICDIDHFKRVNDTLGHLVGDRVLQQVVATIEQRIRSTDIFARWGGEEFVLMLPHTMLADAVKKVEELRAAISQTDFGEAGTVTASFGVTPFRGEDSIDSMISRADNLLYLAKAEGRNCVRSSE